MLRSGSDLDIGLQEYGPRCSRRVVAMSDALIANLPRDGFARYSATHAAVPDYAVGAGPAGIAVAGFPDSAAVECAVPAAAGFDPAYVAAAVPAVALPAFAAGPGSAADRAAVQV